MPTFQNHRKGSPNILGMPGKRFGAASPSYPGSLTRVSKPFRSIPFSTSSLYITGITKDSSGIALSNCVVDLYITQNDNWVATTISDSVGAYSFQILVGGPFFIVAYKAGSPDVMGTTVNTLVGESPNTTSPIISTYATWNPSDKAAGITLSGSNLVATGSGGALEMVRATIGKSAGSWYWEITITVVGSSKIGIAQITESVNGTVGDGANGYGYQDDGQKRNNGSNSAYGASFTTGDIIGVAYDASAGALTFYKNGVSQGVAFSGLSGTFYPAVSGAFTAPTLTANFGPTLSPPGGYNAGIYT